MALSALRIAARRLATRSAATTRMAPATPVRTMASESSAIDAEKTVYVIDRKEAPYSKGKHRSNGLELIEKQPVIEVEGEIAVCDGGAGVLGHPLEYIKIGHRGGEAVGCIYCGLKYRQKGGH